MTTIVIQIGNSDDKLTQAEWAKFVRTVDGWIESCVDNGMAAIHFRGFSVADAAWQNACWVIEWRPGVVGPWTVEAFKKRLGNVAGKFRQDSIAVTVGETEFVKGGDSIH